MELIEIQGTKRYWVVRPGIGASFLHHFQQNECIAIGHIDDCPVTSSGFITPEKMDLVQANINQIVQQQDQDERETTAQLTKRIGTAKTFIGEIQVGDTIITPKDESLLIGTVTSEPFIEKEPLFAVKSNGDRSTAKLDFMLRRKVKWDGIRTKSYMPWQLRESLRSSQAVFSLDKHKTLLEHWLYSIFINDDGLHFSTRISQTNNISQFHITEFQRLIQKLELVADFIVNDAIDLTDETTFLNSIEDNYYIYGLEDKFTLTTSQSFASPGSIWSFVPKISPDDSYRKKLLVLALLVQSSFGANAEEAVQPDLISKTDMIQIHESTEILRTAGHFDDFRRNILASLDERRKTTINITEEAVPNAKPVIFPEVSSEGETGQ
ncbi:hypothetical protein ACFOEW_03435 [Alteromonas oceani]|uniref:Uncharacterized protein n=1 Tax=Alteromonas oceani TaxID=2071609 RepID=A0ABV7JUN5_9ALTE|nr:hypothetical protein [Alteromonas oceani]